MVTGVGMAVDVGMVGVIGGVEVGSESGVGD